MDASVAQLRWILNMIPGDKTNCGRTPHEHKIEPVERLEGAHVRVGP